MARCSRHRGLPFLEFRQSPVSPRRRKNLTKQLLERTWSVRSISLTHAQDRGAEEAHPVGQTLGIGLYGLESPSQGQLSQQTVRTPVIDPIQCLVNKFLL